MSSDNVVQLFGKVEDPLSGDEVERLRDVLNSSVDGFNGLSVLDKYNLFSTVVDLTLKLMSVVHGSNQEGEKG